MLAAGASLFGSGSKRFKTSKARHPCGTILKGPLDNFKLHVGKVSRDAEDDVMPSPNYP